MYLDVHLHGASDAQVATEIAYPKVGTSPGDSPGTPGIETHSTSVSPRTLFVNA